MAGGFVWVSLVTDPPTNEQRALTLADIGVTTGSLGPWTGGVQGRLWWLHDQGQTKDCDHWGPRATYG